MSQENVEIAKRIVDAFNRRDVEGFFALAVPDFEWFPAMGGTAETSGYRGRDGIEKYLVDISDTWEEYRVFAEEFRDLDDRVLMLGRIEGRGRAAVPGSIRRPGRSSGFSTARRPSSAPISITARRCGRLDSLSRRRSAAKL